MNATIQVSTQLKYAIVSRMIKMWPEVEKAKTENRHELVLSGKEITARINQNGLDLSLFRLIDLNYLNISETTLSQVPDEIGNLTNLQTLVLHSNKIEVINENIGKLEKLKNLDLSRNVLKILPDSFTKLPLVTLNLNGNQLERFPTLITKAKLAVLDISYNKLKEFPIECTKELVNLAELRLTGNEIKEVPSNINSLPALKLVELSSNKIEQLPAELADCKKLKDLGLKSNPIKDRRLLKLIDQCRTKQIIDYVKQNCKPTTKKQEKAKEVDSEQNKGNSSESDDDSNTNYQYQINIKYAAQDFQIIVLNNVKSVREHILACIVNDIKFTPDLFKKFIQLQSKLHETVCDKRTAATIATHDFKKLPPGNLTYTTSPPDQMMIQPLGRQKVISATVLLTNLHEEAETLRKEKKRNTYSGTHKYLYLVEGKEQCCCLLEAQKKVISFPPITNAESTKIEVETTSILVEVTSPKSQNSCKLVLDTLLKEMVLLFKSDLNIQQVKTTDIDGNLKAVYPSKTDLKFDNTVPIKVCRK